MAFALAVPALAVVLLAGPARATTVTQTFASSPATWTGSGNQSGSQSFGFTNTSNAGGAAAGEMGGLFSRMSVAYYADLNLGGTFHFDDPLSMTARYRSSGRTGQIVMTRLGFFNTAGNDFIGLLIYTGSSGFAGIAAEVHLPNQQGNGFGQMTTGLALADNTQGTIGFSYVATGGANGLGRLTATVGASSVFYDVTASDRATGMNLNAFGWRIPGDGAANISMTQYADDVTYTFGAVVVPEPGLALLLALAPGFAAARRARGYFRTPYARPTQ